MEVVAPDQLPDLPIGMRDYGYTLIVKHDDGSERMMAYNGERYCPKVIGSDNLPKRAQVGDRCFVNDNEFSYAGDDYGWLVVLEPDKSDDSGEDIVSHPSHYTRGPKIKWWQQGSWNPTTRVLECIEVIRWITDIRLANSVKYIWRVAFGGKAYDGMTLEESMRKDIEKAQWYLKDWLDNPISE